MNEFRSARASALPFVFPFALVLGLLIDSSPGEAVAAGGPEATRTFFQERRESLTREDGWLSLVGLHRLADGEQSIGSGRDVALRVPDRHADRLGTLVRDADGVTFLADDGIAATVDGERVERVEMLSDADGAPTTVEIGSLLFYVIERNDDLYLRVKDRQATLLETFDGVERWDYDPSLNVEARWVEHDEPHELHIPNVLGGTDALECRGEVRFEFEGAVHTLQPTWVGEDRLSFMYGDRTNGVESYGGGRFLYVEGPDADGVIELDFNQSYNPPCAFTPYSTCPMPPEGNVLPFAVRAGEKVWSGGE